MADREKLIELLECADLGCIETQCHSCGHFYTPNKHDGIPGCVESRVADHLIANGVTFASDNNVGKWIPVTERLPELIPCDAGTAYSEAVSVLTTGRKVLTAIWDGMDFIADAAFWEAEGEKVTHWAPVLLPLPEPPKGE